MLKIIEKYKNIILLSIGILLIVLSIVLISYDKFELLKSNVFDEVELLKYEENKKEEKETKNNDEEVINDIDTNIVENNYLKKNVNVNKK